MTGGFPVRSARHNDHYFDADRGSLEISALHRARRVILRNPLPFTMQNQQDNHFQEAASRAQDQGQRLSLALHQLQHWNIDLLLQTLKKWLVKGLPKGSSLTAIFDSCHSGTLLGNVSSTHIHYPLLLMLRKTSTITNATMYTGLGSTGVVVGATPSETTLVRRHHAPLPVVAHRLILWHSQEGL